MTKIGDEHAEIDLALVALLRPLGEDGACFDTICTVLSKWSHPQLARGLVRLSMQGLARSKIVRGEKITRWIYVVPPGLRHRFAPPL